LNHLIIIRHSRKATYDGALLFSSPQTQYAGHGIAGLGEMITIKSYALQKMPVTPIFRIWPVRGSALTLVHHHTVGIDHMLLVSKVMLEVVRKFFNHIQKLPIPLHDIRIMIWANGHLKSKTNFWRRKPISHVVVY
jgi:hypothetical protein